MELRRQIRSFGQLDMITILILILLISVYNAWKLSGLKTTLLSHKMVSIINCFMGIHVIYTLVCRIWFPELKYLNRFGPFMVVYGPFIYLFIVAQGQHVFPRKTVIAHGALPLVLWTLFIILIAGNLVGTPYDKLFRASFSAATIASIFFYTVLIAVKYFRNEISKQIKIFILSTMILLVCTAMIVLFFNLYQKQIHAAPLGLDTLSPMVYCIMLLASLLIFFYQNQHHKDSNKLEPDLTELDSSYKKSSITAPELHQYEQKLVALMENEQTYLKPDLSLKYLAQELRIPQHHLTQVLNTQIKQNYHTYINTLRIEHACSLIKADGDCTLQDIASNSGFNSMVTFNRSFKTVKNMLPTTYRAKVHG